MGSERMTDDLLRQLIELHTQSLRLQRLLLERLAGSSEAVEPEPERPPLRVVGGTAGRYYKPAAPPAPVSLEHVETLRAIQDAGETARLVLAFGPHAGETLGQVAQTDATYLRTLALSARRPDVRAAARHMVSLLPDSKRRPRERRD